MVPRRDRHRGTRWCSRRVAATRLLLMHRRERPQVDHRRRRALRRKSGRSAAYFYGVCARMCSRSRTDRMRSGVWFRFSLKRAERARRAVIFRTHARQRRRRRQRQRQRQRQRTERNATATATATATARNGTATATARYGNGTHGDATATLRRRTEATATARHATGNFPDSELRHPRFAWTHSLREGMELATTIGTRAARARRKGASDVIALNVGRTSHHHCCQCGPHRARERAWLAEHRLHVPSDTHYFPARPREKLKSSSSATAAADGDARSWRTQGAERARRSSRRPQARRARRCPLQRSFTNLPHMAQHRRRREPRTETGRDAGRKRARHHAGEHDMSARSCARCAPTRLHRGLLDAQAHGRAPRRSATSPTSSTSSLRCTSEVRGHVDRVRPGQRREPWRTISR